MAESRRRLQVRVTLDSDMGSLFQWASEIPERARARELVGLLRVGFALASGAAGPGLAGSPITGMRAEPEPSSRPAARGNAPQFSKNLEEQAADATLEIFDESAVTGVPPA